MKKLLVLFIILSFLGCKKDSFDVIADFTTAEEVYHVNTEIHFINTSDYSDSWTWDFGDGRISNRRNPIKIYEVTGKYEISLMASNGKDYDVFRQNIIVFLEN